MKNILCLVGRHAWQHHFNEEMGGPNSGYDLCSRCGKEKKSFEPGNPSFKGPLGGF